MTSRPRHLGLAEEEEKVTYRMVFDIPGKPFGDNSKPTLLAFHGSGSNSTCNRVQLARLNMVLKKDYNILVFEAPFTSPAGPGILPFFEDCGPFARWLPPTEKVTIEAMKRGESTPHMAPEVESLIKTTIHDLRAQGGRVAGLIGFSQGTKVIAGLLKATEIRRSLGIEEEDWCDFGFGVSVCGSYPPALLPGSIRALAEKKGADVEALMAAKIEIPTFHVQGETDEFKWAGLGLIERHYEVAEGKSVVFEWAMGHQYPILPAENEMIGKWIEDVVKAQ